MLIWKNENYKIFKLNCIRCNCFVLQYEDYNTLIDTSMKIDRKRLMNSLHKNGIKKIDAILLTHNHMDHAGNATYLQKIFDCPIYASEKGIEDLEKGCCELPLGNLKHGKEISDFVNRTRFRRISEYEPCKKVHNITEIFNTPFLGQDVEVIETPGHMKDSISILVDKRVAFVGDAMVRLPWKKTVFLPWANDPENILPTWKKLLDTKCKFFLQSHGPSTTRKMLQRSVSEFK